MMLSKVHHLNIHIDNDSCNYLIIFSSLIGDKTLGDNIWYYLHNNLMGQEKIIQNF